MNNNTLTIIQTHRINKSLSIFKTEAVSYRKRDLEQFEGTDYLQDLTDMELSWYLDNCEDFLYNTSTTDSKRRDVYSTNPISNEIILDNYISEDEDYLITLLKYYGDKRLVTKHLKRDLDDEIKSFPEDSIKLGLKYASKALWLKNYR